MKTTKMLAILVLALGLATEVANADFTFGEPTNMGPPINTSSGDATPCSSSDGLEMYLVSERPGGYGGWDIWLTTRETIDDDWGEPMNLGPKVNGPQHEAGVCISFDGLVLYFNSRDRPGGYGGVDIWVATRETTGDDWATPVNLGPTVNSPDGDYGPNLSADGLTLFFASDRPGGYGSIDIWLTSRTTINDSWGPPVNLGAVVNSSANENYAFISADSLSLYFTDFGIPQTIPRPGGYGGGDLWVTNRVTIEDPWGTPVNLGPMVNSSSHDGGLRISLDGSMLYFSSERPGGLGGLFGDIYQAPIIPIVDFNGDGIVDSADMCIMVDNWNTDEPLCDIGPTPFGDGIVDVQDLIVLAEHLFEEIPPVEVEPAE